MNNKLWLGLVTVLLLLALAPSSYSENVTNTTTMTVNVIVTGAFNITNVAVGSITQNGAHVTWTTNRPANSTVFYGKVTLGTKVFNADFVTSHDVALTGLSASTKYYLNVTSCDVFGQCNRSGNYSFTTSATPVAPTGPGGGGGGGGGGGIVPIPECDEMWWCDLWSACSKDGTRTRECVDLFQCGTDEKKPIDKESCIYTPKQEEVQPEEIKVPVVEKPAEVQAPRISIKPIIDIFKSYADRIGDIPTKLKLFLVALLLFGVTIAIYFTGLRRPTHLLKLDYNLGVINKRLGDINQEIEQDFEKLKQKRK